MGVLPPAKFLGRTLDVNTMTYSFKDNSVPLPIEMKYEVEDATYHRVWCASGTQLGNGLAVLGTLFSWKRRLGIE